MDQLYVYRWGRYLPALKGQRCRVLARGKLNTALVEFVETGVKHVVSRNALRKVK